MATNRDKAALAVSGQRSGGAEVVPRDAYGQLKQAIEQNAQAFGRVLAGQNVEAYQQAVMNAAIANPEILSCDIRSIVGAALVCAQTGLQPGPQGYAYIVPYNTKENGRWLKKAQFQYGYKGLIKLAYQTGKVSFVEAIPVYEKDQFEFANTHEGQTFKHVPAFGKDRGEVVLILSLIRFKDGTSHALPVEVEFINSIRDMSKGYKNKDGSTNKGSPWSKHWLAMAQKTALKQHFKTAELGDAVAAAVAADEKTVTWTPAKAAQVEAAGAEVTALKDETPWNESEVEEDTVTGEVIEDAEVEDEPPGMDAEQFKASRKKPAPPISPEYKDEVQEQLAKAQGKTAGEEAGVSDDLSEYVDAAADKLGATLEEDDIPPATECGYSSEQARDRQVKSLFQAARTMGVSEDTLRAWMAEEGVKHSKQLAKAQVIRLIRRIGQSAA